MDPFVSDTQTWAMTQFGTADLHDKRRTNRFCKYLHLYGHNDGKDKGSRPRLYDNAAPRLSRRATSVPLKTPRATEQGEPARSV